MRIQIKVLKEDDERFNCSENDIVIIDADYDWDDDKVLGLFNVTKGEKLDNAFYKTQLRPYKALEFI